MSLSAVSHWPMSLISTQMDPTPLAGAVDNTPAEEGLIEATAVSWLDNSWTVCACYLSRCCHCWSLKPLVESTEEHHSWRARRDPLKPLVMSEAEEAVEPLNPQKKAAIDDWHMSFFLMSVYWSIVEYQQRWHLSRVLVAWGWNAKISIPTPVPVSIPFPTMVEGIGFMSCRRRFCCPTRRFAVVAASIVAEATRFFCLGCHLSSLTFLSPICCWPGSLGNGFLRFAEEDFEEIPGFFVADFSRCRHLAATVVFTAPNPYFLKIFELWGFFVGHLDDHFFVVQRFF